MNDDEYETDTTKSGNWTLMLGDSCERMNEIETETIDLSICSPPFATLFVYSATPRDLANSVDMQQFLNHYRYIIDQQLRVTKPGRVACIHVQQLATRKSQVGYMGLIDFRGKVIQEFVDAGWIFYGEVTVWKNPQALRDGTPVLTPTGWVAIERLNVGDMVIGVTGEPTAVIAIPYKGVQPIYRVTLSGGGEIYCGPEHLWTVRDGTQQPWYTTRTDQITHAVELPRLDGRGVETARSIFPKSPRYIKRVELTGQLAPVTCISVAADDGLFVTEHFAVTHNSQAIRTKAHPLMFVTKNKDSAASRPALADYLLLFKKPGENKVPIKTDVTNQEWIEYAAPIWEDHHDGGWLTENGSICPVWYGIRETDTLNVEVAREYADERHICLASGSLVLTREHGYISIDDASRGMHVLSHRGQWCEIKAKRCNGIADVVKTTAHGVANMITTPDHEFWARNSNDRQSAMKLNPEWVKACHSAGSYVNIKLPPIEESKLTKKEWWIVGRWLADGHRGGHKYSGKRNGLGQFIISCGHHKSAELIERLGENAGHIAKVTADQIVLVGLRHEVREVLDRCGSGAANKKLPGEAVALNVELSESLLDGYLSGDGHYVAKYDRWCASSVSRALLLGMAMVAQRARGVVASVYAGRPDRDGIIQGRKVHMRQDWILSFRNSDGLRKSGWIDDQGAWKKVRRVANVAEPHQVWDLRVETDESFTAEGMIVHNCPLQLPFIERCVRLWSNPGEVVLTPFAGIGSEVYKAVELGRKGIGIELKQRYYRVAVGNMQALDRAMSRKTRR